MATTIAKLNIHLGTTTAGLQQGFTEGIRLTQAFDSKVKGIGGGGGGGLAGLLGIGGGLPGKLAAMATAAAATMFSVQGVQSAIQRMDATAEGAANLGTTTADLTRLHHAAQLAGSSAQGIDQGLAIMEKKLGQARAGSDEAGEAFEKLGLNVNKLANLDPTQAFGEIAEQIDRLPTAADKAAAAFAIFGRSGHQLLGVLNLGKDGLAAMAEESDSLGKTLSGEQAKSAEVAADSIDRFMAAVEGLGNVIVGEFGEEIAVLINFFTTLLQAAQQVVKAFGAIIDLVGAFEVVTGVDLLPKKNAEPKIDPAVASEFAKIGEEEQAAAAATKEFQNELKQMADEGKRVAESVRTPLESYQDRIAHLNLLVNRGAISWETYQRAAAQAAEELDKATTKQKDFNVAATTQIGAVTRFSTAGFSAVHSAVAESSRLEEQARRQVEEQKAANRRLEEIKRNTAKPAVRVKEVNL